ncbi:hypothetical protein DFP95_12448 [Cohnella lupini]|uniref:Uncharacterized protein n=1 Tax=Cohnella lupini TaxID=1294267 RepID=A0A3D9HYD2_9BACL|nr:hypothetical protein DFP95_12448 [Cohnella lupini]
MGMFLASRRGDFAQVDPMYAIPTDRPSSDEYKGSDEGFN